MEERSNIKKKLSTKYSNRRCEITKQMYKTFFVEVSCSSSNETI